MVEREKDSFTTSISYYIYNQVFLWERKRTFLFPFVTESKRFLPTSPPCTTLDFTKSNLSAHPFSRFLIPFHIFLTAKLLSSSQISIHSINSWFLFTISISSTHSCRCCQWIPGKAACFFSWFWQSWFVWWWAIWCSKFITSMAAAARGSRRWELSERTTRAATAECFPPLIFS